jgi:hypothetical protein
MTFNIALLLGLFACGGDEPTPDAKPIEVEVRIKAPARPEAAQQKPQSPTQANGERSTLGGGLAGGDNSDCSQQLKVYEDCVAAGAGADGADGADGGADLGCGQELNNYEEFVGEYIEYMQKVSAGDMSALTQAQGIMTKSQSASLAIIKLQENGDFDVACFRKYQEINNKMTTAALEMAGASDEDKAEVEDAQEALDDALDSVACMQTCENILDAMEKITCLQGCQ